MNSYNRIRALTVILSADSINFDSPMLAIAKYIYDYCISEQPHISLKPKIYTLLL